MTVPHTIRLALLAAALPLLAACATSHMITGTPRAPIDPAQVRIYYGPPPGGYEEIARLETSSGAFTYGEQNKSDSVLAKLRGEAARLGANGILFQGTQDGYGGGGASVGLGGGRIGGSGFSSAGVGVNISPRQKYASGIAVYVANPPPDQAPAQAPPPR
ncbi:MAG TPA: hypothetical protein VLK29_09160 [Luteimonas sp.]|nr:hypothetical protein [Luteimonas sp.]